MDLFIIHVWRREPDRINDLPQVTQIVRSGLESLINEMVSLSYSGIFALRVKKILF
jgi:hypothetical protein